MMMHEYDRQTELPQQALHFATLLYNKSLTSTLGDKVDDMLLSSSL